METLLPSSSNSPFPSNRGLMAALVKGGGERMVHVWVNKYAGGGYNGLEDGRRG